MSTATIKAADFTKTLPPALTYDERLVALAKALSLGLASNAKLMDVAGLFYRIDELPENVLDMLAGDLHVEWYDQEANIETKRAAIKSSVYIHRHRGTPAAAQRVIEDNFGDGSVEEWFDYGGEPHHFRVTTSNPEKVYENIDRFLKLLEKTKRVSAVLDNVEIVQEMTVRIGTAVAMETRYEYSITSETADPMSLNIVYGANMEILTDQEDNILLY